MDPPLFLSPPSLTIFFVLYPHFFCPPPQKKKKNPQLFLDPKKTKKIWTPLKKSRIRVTLNLSINPDSSTDTTLGWTKNTQKKPKK